MNWWERGGPDSRRPGDWFFWALIFFPQCHWVYRAFEDVEELQRERGEDEEEDSPFKPYPVENGSDHEEDKSTNGTGETCCCEIVCSLLFCLDLKFYQCRSMSLISVWSFQSPIPLRFFRSCQLVSFQSAKMYLSEISAALAAFCLVCESRLIAGFMLKTCDPAKNITSKHYVPSTMLFCFLFFSFDFWLGSYSPCR